MPRSETLVSFVRKDFDYYRIVLLPAFILFIVLSFMLLQVVHDLRINEVGITLQKASHDDESSSALLLERFRMLIKESGQGETAEAYLRESKLMALMSDVRIMPPRATRIAWLETPAIFLINLMAFLTASDYY